MNKECSDVSISATFGHVRVGPLLLAETSRRCTEALGPGTGMGTLSEGSGGDGGLGRYISPRVAWGRSTGEPNWDANVARTEAATGLLPA